jgi:UDP-glucose 4-epimerase
MRAIVTGGAGFIGSNLVDALLARGDRVTAIDDLSTGKPENLQTAIERGARLCVLDIRRPEELAAAIGEEQPDAIFHLAAQIDVRRSIRDPVWDASINVEGTINVLEAARVHGVARIVNSSTGGAIYGEALTIPSDEQTPPLPEAAYGQSKLAAEGYLGLYERLYGSSSVTLRYGNVYGPRQDPLGEAGVIAIFTGLLEKGGRPTVYGDGLQTRDYVYVDDVVAANLLAATTDAPGTYNIGTGIETDVVALHRLIAAGAGRGDDRPQHGPGKPGEQRRSCLDTSLAAARLGWRPAVELADGLNRTVDHFRRQAATATATA